jgi:protein-S-isoprenylcysteine O-methyltransferase Ste14
LIIIREKILSIWNNLWLYYGVAYIIAYSTQVWANKKRGEPFDDPEFLFSKKIIVIVAMIWLFGGLAISFFVPVDYGILFYIGFPLFILGLLIGELTMYSFARNKGLTTSKIHHYSRNPIYVGTTIMYLGLTLIGWSESIWSIIFFIYFIITMPYFHWTVLLEEAFLKNKYGDAYDHYLKTTPRYLGRPKKGTPSE